MNPETEMKKLMKIKAIGSWTENDTAMREMERPGAFLETDIGIKRALPGYTLKELLAMLEKWKPRRSYAAVNL